MDKEYIRQRLPEEPPEGLLRWTIHNCDGELGPNYLPWNPVRVPIYDMSYLMDNKLKPQRYERVADCTCLKCGGHFLTERSGNILTMWVNECGEWWPVDPTGPGPYDDEDQAGAGYTMELGCGDIISCPFCYESVCVIEEKRLRGGRKKQILVVSIEKIEQYAVVVYWLVQRTIYDDSDYYDALPRDAYVLDERGILHRYSHKSGGGAYYAETQEDYWRYSANKKDSLDMCYSDWGSINNKKKGGLFYPKVPDLSGTTAEKTGLQAYAKYNGVYSLQYLKLWKKYRNLENLTNTGWTSLVNTIVVKTFDGYAAPAEMNKVIDITKTKPHEMLGIPKRDFKALRNKGDQWDYDCQRLWQSFRESGYTSALQFRIYRDMFTDAGMRVLATLRNQYGEVDPEKLIRYLKKQNMRPAEIRILLDTREAARYLAGDRPLTHEELWPRNLAAAHDRFTRARIQSVDLEKAKRYQKGFDAVVDKYGQLQWTDGELCIILPKSHTDLVTEGNVLRHCVGGYSDSHVSGNDTIFFVRKYRRPERSYYTLDINMVERPYRVQLHGYGNERHGTQKQYSHKIPRKVLDFCDRWEREILMPWWRDHNKDKEKTT